MRQYPKAKGSFSKSYDITNLSIEQIRLLDSCHNAIKLSDSSKVGAAVRLTSHRRNNQMAQNTIGINGPSIRCENNGVCNHLYVNNIHCSIDNPFKPLS